MKKINLLNHQGLSFEAFKTWLNQLIANKKGALPDLNDWKEIKAKLEQVRVPKQQIKEVPKVVQITNERELLETFGKECDDCEYGHHVPWMTSELAPAKTNEEIDDDMDMHMDLMRELEYYLNKIEHCTFIPPSYMLETTYNGHPVQLDINYAKTKERDNNDNNSCCGA